MHFDADPHTAELLLLTNVSVNPLSMYGAVADWCQELTRRAEAHPSQGTGRPVAEMTGDQAQHVPLEVVSSPTKCPLCSQRARGHPEAKNNEKYDHLSENLQLTKASADAGFTSLTLCGNMMKSTKIFQTTCVATQFCLCRTQAGDVDVRCCARSWTCCTQEGKTSPCLLTPRDHVGQDGHELCESPLSAETNCTVCRHWYANVYLDLHGLGERKS